MKPPTAGSVFIAQGAAVPSATPAAAGGQSHITAPQNYDAILLASFGGPEAPEDVVPFLRNVTAGRGIPDERLEEVGEHYFHYGGVSPINAQVHSLGERLQGALAEAGLDLPVLVGNRNWHPYITDTIAQAHRDGLRRLLMIPTSAYSSYSSCRQYREDVADALDHLGLADVMQVDKVRQYFNHPGFVQPFIDGVRSAIAQLAADGARRIRLLFTTHSVPMSDAGCSGPPELAERFGPGGAYEAQHLAVARQVMADVESLGQADLELSWELVFQSRSGPPSQPWLEPDINDVIEGLAEVTNDSPAPTDAVVIVPVGFLSDHMEVLWDLDNEALDTAGRVGLPAIRVATPGTAEEFVSGLVDLVQERTEGREAQERAATTDIEPWFDVCRPGCCENRRRGFTPAVAGLKP